MSHTGTARALAISRNRIAVYLSKRITAGGSANFNNAGFKMTAALKMRDLAHRLLTYEAGAGNASEPMESPTLRVYEKLRRGLGEFAGAAGFQSLASRALALARTEVPNLSAARISADGALHGLGYFETQFDIDNNQAGEGGIILIARFLGLLRIFLGEALTLSLLRNTWPGEVFDDRNSANGRKA